MTTTTSLPPRKPPRKLPRIQPIDPILLEYLYNKLHGNPVSTTFNVIDCSLYSDQEPWEIWENNGGNELKPNSHLYVITKLKKLTTKIGNRNRHARGIGRCGGSWQGEDSGLDIPNGAGRFVGVKKRFRYENEKGSWKHEQHGRWIVYQFVLNDDMLPAHITDDYAICAFKKNENRTAGQKRKNEDTESVVAPRPPRKRNIVNKIKPPVVLGDAHPAINRIKKAKTDAESVILPLPPSPISQPLNCDSDKDKPQVVVVDEVHRSMKPQQDENDMGPVLALPAVPRNINDTYHDGLDDSDEEGEDDDDEGRGPGWIARFAEELLMYSDIDTEADPLMPNMRYNCCHEHFMGWQKLSY